MSANRENPSKSTRKNRNDWIGFFKELKEESPRGAVLIGAAVVEEHLRQLLLAFFVDEALVKEKDKVSTKLFNGPLGNLSTKINVAYSLGLISTEEHHDLHILRDIRNQCAHALHGFSFSDEWVIEQCNKLYWPKKLTGYDIVGPRDFLYFTFSHLALLLRTRTGWTTKQRRKIRENVAVTTGLSQITISSRS